MREWISTFRGVLGEDAVRVHHYDSHHGSLAGHFFAEVLGIAEPPQPGPTVVNGSLTPLEIEVMREVNRRVSSRSAARLASDELPARPPRGDPVLRLTAGDLALLEDRFADEVEWINRHALDRPVLSVRGTVMVAAEGLPEADGGPVRADVLATAVELAEHARAGAAAPQ